MIKTEAYFLTVGSKPGQKGELTLGELWLPSPKQGEVLVKPLIGSWEGNMTHAINRVPIDICALRQEERVVIGNAGVVEILDAGHANGPLRPGDICILFCNGEADAYGYPVKIFGYDQPGSRGLLSKLAVVPEKQLIKIDRHSRGSMAQWAAFSLRYITAWSNWRAAFACWRAQMSADLANDCNVMAWGGGVSFAELSLAQLQNGCSTAMIASHEVRLGQIRKVGIAPIARPELSGEQFAEYLEDQIHAVFGKSDVSIIIDNIGAHYQLSLRLLARQGVLASSGWKAQAIMPTLRSAECIARHIHVFTHYATMAEGEQAVRFAEEHDWLPPTARGIWSWDDIPNLASSYDRGDVVDLFPVFRVND